MHTFLGPPPTVSDPVGQWFPNQPLCSTKFPGEADAAGLETTL